MSSLTYIGQQLTIYFGIPLLIAGSLGALLNIIVFLSLHTFRQSPCAFYLTVMSFVNIGQLLTGLLSRIMISGYGINWTATSLVYCKLRSFVLQMCTLISLTCICLATIDQYLATCVYARLRQWSSLRVAHRLTSVFVIFWSLYASLYLIFYVIVYSSSAGNTSCQSSNAVFSRYHFYGQSIALTVVLPACITIFFALMAYRNVRDIAHRTIPMVRQQLEKQLTKMVLVQVAFNSWTLLPLGIVLVLQNNSVVVSDPVTLTRLQFANTITIMAYYVNFASPFYIYMCVSERFRQQLMYVLRKMLLNIFRRRMTIPNEIAPE